MGILKAVRHRKPAQGLNDLDVPESVWTPDFDIVDRYQCFANELMRIALLGIGGYGFLIKELLTEKDGFCAQAMGKNASYIGGGAIGLCLTLIFVLIFRFYSTYCLYYQLLIIRSLKRLDNPQWTDEDKNAEQHFLKQTRDIQRKKALLSRRLLISAAACFAFGVIFIIVFFLRILPAWK